MINRQRPNIASALGEWSTRHRKLAIFGWLAFVIVAMFLGNASGQAGLANYQQLAGGSAQAEKILDQAGIKDPSAEVVLVQGRGPRPFRVPIVQAAVDATVAAWALPGSFTISKTPIRTTCSRPTGKPRSWALTSSRATTPRSGPC